MVRYIATFILLLFSSIVAAAQDANGYTSRYECISGGAVCNVDVTALVNQACQQIIGPTDSWSSINWSNNVICLAAGDHRSKGTLFINQSGSSSSRKMLRHSSITSTHPYKQSGAQRATLSRIDITNRAYVVIDGLHLNPGFSDNAVFIGGTSNNIILNRMFTENTNSQQVLVNTPSASDIWIQNSVMKDCATNSDWAAVGFFGGPVRMRVVNNEILGCPKGVYTQENGAVGAVIENNDMYVPTYMYTDCNGVLDVNGTCALAEIMFGHKSGGTQAEPMIIIHNRAWGTRRSDPTVGGGTEGYLVSISNNFDDPSAGTKWTLFRDNILMDAQGGIHSYWDFLNNNSFVGNIMYKMRAYNTSVISAAMEGMFMDNSEYYFNTIIDASQWFGSFSNGENQDIRCNVIISAGSAFRDSPGSGTQIDYNVFYGTGASGSNFISQGLTTRANSTAYSVGTILRTNGNVDSCSSDGIDQDCFLYRVIIAGTTSGSPSPYCIGLGCTSTDGTVTVKAIRGPYTFFRKLLTGPEQVSIPYAKMHTSAVESKYCPGLGAANAVGARINIGINDDVAPVGIFSLDITGAAR